MCRGWVSPAYEREYRDWIERGQFARLREREADDATGWQNDDNPWLLVDGLATLATCYGTRGAVRLLDGDQAGWEDIQAAYMASMYKLRFADRGLSLPAWSSGHTPVPRLLIELPAWSALGGVFGQSDESWWTHAIETYFDMDAATGDIVAGRAILRSLLDRDANTTPEELLEDRKACCRTREGWPTRLTEICPFGVLDVEVLGRWPDRSCVSLPTPLNFTPTPDPIILSAIELFHTRYG